MLKFIRTIPWIQTSFLSGLILISVLGTGILSYSLGYRKGAGEIILSPSAFLNAASTGEPSIALEDPGTKTDFGDFWRTWYVLEKNFTPTSTTTASSTPELRVAGAIEGLVRSYGDPYTVFIPKEQAAAFKESVNGEFEGIGAVLGILDEVVTVGGVLPKSPAEGAGIASGDRIIAVDGVPTLGKDLGDIIPNIRGPKGTIVALTIISTTTKTESIISVTRGTVVIPTTATRVISAAKKVVDAAVSKAQTAAAALAGGAKAVPEEQRIKEEEAAKQTFFVLQLSSFAKSSTDAFITDLKQFAQSDTQNLIIDLRNNPGGYLEVAADLASYFLPKDALIVTETTGTTHQSREFRSEGYAAFGNAATTSRRIVVLLNRNSASASEILAGALQDHGVAKIVGETSFGKGSVQTLVDIGNLGSLKITIARWYTPSGKNISHTGITPDIAIDPAAPQYASSTDPFIDGATETLLDDALWNR